MSKSAVNVVLGAGSWGTKPTIDLKVEGDINIVQSILDVFKKHGHNELDTARAYVCFV